ncbi:MAG TPA: hypothetical protein VMV52_10090 [Candidatus Nanopelagicaceae bacterium]|nr:hypothetical protein [Candidatus Nanopelagicaceae bacterium]
MRASRMQLAAWKALGTHFAGGRGGDFIQEVHTALDRMTGLVNRVRSGAWKATPVNRSKRPPTLASADRISVQ